MIIAIEKRQVTHRNHEKTVSRYGHAFVLGITGPPGAGKSTLTHTLATSYRNQGKTVGIIAIDPTSPFRGPELS